MHPTVDSVEFCNTMNREYAHLSFLLSASSTPIFDLGARIPEVLERLPFSDFSQNLFDELDIGSALDSDTRQVDDEATGIILESLGQDVLIFLAASVVVSPLSNTLGVSPILGYLILGALLGSHGLDVFANAKADVELGDFGILFLLFSEGLEVSRERLSKLANYLPLGVAQLSLCSGVLSAGILLVAPTLERFLPSSFDNGLLDITSPVEALVLALAGTLSTSAFVFPVLKEREWEEEPSGQAATSILLLQDLAVAPLLVLMPYLVGTDGSTDYTAIAFLTAKATIGFGTVIYLGSIVLRKLFDLIATTRSAETFVALCLLVSVGIGEIAKGLGLTDTAGAFAAGVLLANTNYRAQIQADILPFKGILLGIFFMSAGSSFDVDIVLNEFSTVFAGASALILLKAITLFLATRVPEWMERNRLPVVDGIRLSFLLSGGGEFAFVVLALAEKLGVLPAELGSLLTAIVLITMAVTPFLGELAELASNAYSEQKPVDKNVNISLSADLGDGPTPVRDVQVANDAIVVCGYGEIGQACLRVLYEEYKWINEYVEANQGRARLPKLVAFDSDPTLVGRVSTRSEDAVVLFGDGTNPSVLTSSGIIKPVAIFVSYEDMERVLSATARLCRSFPETPVFARAPTRRAAQALKDLGASEVVIESDELPRSASALVWSTNPWSPSRELLSDNAGQERLKQVAVVASGVPFELANRLFEVYKSIDQDFSGQVSADEVANYISKSPGGVHSDDEVHEMVSWVQEAVDRPLDVINFFRLYSRSSPMIKQALLGNQKLDA
jgi:Kef-type K+ transport system membrane component KefB